MLEITMAVAVIVVLCGLLVLFISTIDDESEKRRLYIERVLKITRKRKL